MGSYAQSQVTPGKAVITKLHMVVFILIALACLEVPNSKAHLRALKEVFSGQSVCYPRPAMCRNADAQASSCVLRLTSVLAKSWGATQSQPFWEKHGEAMRSHDEKTWEAILQYITYDMYIDCNILYAYGIRFQGKSLGPSRWPKNVAGCFLLSLGNAGFPFGAQQRLGLRSDFWWNEACECHIMSPDPTRCHQMSLHITSIMYYSLLPAELVPIATLESPLRSDVLFGDSR